MHKNVEKMSLNYSPNFNLKKRSNSSVKYLIFHYTGMKSETKAIKRLTDINSKVSCHYLVKRDGEIIQMVPDLYIAWHAGISFWKNFKKINNHSIGVEIHNPGHRYRYDNFNKRQIKSMIWGLIPNWSKNKKSISKLINSTWLIIYVSRNSSSRSVTKELNIYSLSSSINTSYNSFVITI